MRFLTHVRLSHIFNLPIHRFLTFESAKDAIANRPRLDEGSYLRLMKRLDVDPAPHEPESTLRGTPQQITAAGGSGTAQLPPLFRQLPVVQQQLVDHEMQPLYKICL